MLGTTEILIIGLVILVLFGATAIPRFAKSLGKAKREFQDGLKEGESEKEREKGQEEENKKKEDSAGDDS
jgi:sec-independent protein translocase protein TatA